MGQRVLEITGLTHGYGDRRLFDSVDLEIEKGERVAVIGEAAPCSLER
jgi:macrolide transport system ATP-binding/permease protein